jgi:hypothetical protein
LGSESGFLVAPAEGRQIGCAVFQQERQDVSFLPVISSKNAKMFGETGGFLGEVLRQFGRGPVCGVLGLFWARRHEDDEGTKMTKARRRVGRGCMVGMVGPPFF